MAISLLIINQFGSFFQNNIFWCTAIISCGCNKQYGDIYLHLTLFDLWAVDILQNKILKKKKFCFSLMSYFGDTTLLYILI